MNKQLVCQGVTETKQNENENERPIERPKEVLMRRILASEERTHVLYRRLMFGDISRRIIRRMEAKE